jgi:N-acetylmuramoyl-L-alanine amidase
MYPKYLTDPGTSQTVPDIILAIPIVPYELNIGPPELVVGRPANFSVTTHTNEYCILGASDPQIPLKMNGEEILTRTEEGYFSAHVTLSPGSNSFVFTQDGQETLTRLITYQPGGSSGGTPPIPAIVPTPSGQSPLAEVSAANAYVYPSPTTSGGSCGELSMGQTDTISATASDGKWIKLGIGVWIQASDIKRLPGQPLTNNISAPQYAAGDKWDTVSYPMTIPAASTLTYDGNKLSLKIRGSSTAAPPALPGGSPFSQLNITTENGVTTQDFILKPGQRIEGYYTEISGNTLILHIKKRLQAGDTTLPLQNLVILLDPGHGGPEPGAFGPLGAKLPEKAINLSTAFKIKYELEKLGATVEMTRTGDDELSLHGRVEKSRALRPDLFLSIHANSLDESRDGARTMGISTWHKERVSEDFSSFMYDFLWNDLNRPRVGTHQANFYVCRPTWAPSFLIETGFLCNPWEFSWLVNAREQDRLARSIARGIASYYMTP